MLPRWLSLRPVVPQSWENIDCKWMAGALKQAFPDYELASIQLIDSVDGTNRRARFELEWAREGGPRRVFIKAHTKAHRRTHWRNGNLFGESRLYASGAHLPLEVPKVYLAVPDYPRLDFLLLMEDLNLRGCDPRDSMRPLTIAQAESGVIGLAKLHSHYWGMQCADARKLTWVKPWEPSQGWQIGMRRMVPRGLERGKDLLPSGLQDKSGDWVMDQWVRFVTSLSDGTPTLLHGDAHVGNIYVLPDNNVGFLDWQVVRKGGFIQDLGYFIVGALTEVDRRAAEHRLLDTYRKNLCLPLAFTPSVDEIWLKYRMSHAYGLAIWLSTLGTDGYQEPEISRALVSRYVTAFDEQDTLHALEEAGY